MRLPSPALLLVLCAVAVPRAAGPDLTGMVVATATVQPRTAVRVSRDVLRFVVPAGAREATDSIEFTAKARTMPQADVRLLIEAGSVLEAVSGVTLSAALTYVRDEEGVDGVLEPGTARVACRWSGGGARNGRLDFSLRDVPPGTYLVPIRLTVSVP